MHPYVVFIFPGFPIKLLIKKIHKFLIKIIRIISNQLEWLE